jgi:hypothetical protein
VFYFSASALDFIITGRLTLVAMKNPTSSVADSKLDLRSVQKILKPKDIIPITTDRKGQITIESADAYRKPEIIHPGWTVHRVLARLRSNKQTLANGGLINGRYFR